MDDKLKSALAACKRAQGSKEEFTRQQYLHSVPAFGSTDTWGKRLKQLVEFGAVEKLEVMGHYRVVNDDTGRENL